MEFGRKANGNQTTTSTCGGFGRLLSCSWHESRVQVLLLDSPLPSSEDSSIDYNMPIPHSPPS